MSWPRSMRGSTERTLLRHGATEVPGCTYDQSNCFVLYRVAALSFLCLLSELFDTHIDTCRRKERQAKKGQQSKLR